MAPRRKSGRRPLKCRCLYTHASHVSRLNDERSEMFENNECAFREQVGTCLACNPLAASIKPSMDVANRRPMGKFAQQVLFRFFEVRMALMRHVFFAKKRQLFWNFHLVQKAFGFRLLRIKEEQQRFFRMDYTMSNCFLHGRCLLQLFRVCR